MVLPSTVGTTISQSPMTDGHDVIHYSIGIASIPTVETSAACLGALDHQQLKYRENIGHNLQLVTEETARDFWLFHSHAVL